ncbi:hypothetical protein K466DRAFT_503083 [Polyporus arcularius HHB13444]|uniref:CxC5 like cysteine cluster associated with KDZ domain-containing protein n=1 Tax=Polyporus arcularius HHB13444 TaxID=1314778 RepID=A0A5C3NU87_9APHY|nr:hypothetical protein K466DRAFT_503083 [Polyporus arcularius HHB13444]
MDLNTIFTRLETRPQLRQNITMEQVLGFIALTTRLVRDINHCQPLPVSASGEPPPTLPPSIVEFLEAALKLSPEDAEECWETFREVVWDAPAPEVSVRQVETMFEVHGHPSGLSESSQTFYPPNIVCTQPACTNRKPLKKSHSEEVVAFTRALGPRPAWAVHLYCNECKTSYHNNYHIQAGQRQYYLGVPEFIQVGEHQYVERLVAEDWIGLMVSAWVSASNLANTYNFQASMPRQMHAASTQFRTALTTEQVWDTIVVLALLEDADYRNAPLRTPHTGDQKNRFVDAMTLRNERMILEGQPELTHYCDNCMRVYDNPDGTQNKTQAILSDGIAMGRPCCGEFKCQIPLANNCHRFCPTHFHLHFKCAVIGCNADVAEGSKSCPDPVHQEMERQLHLPGRSMALLSARLRHVITARTDSSVAVEEVLAAVEGEVDGEVEFQEHAGQVQMQPQPAPGSIGTLEPSSNAFGPSPCPATKSDSGNRKHKALWNRRRTHNEQILVRPCGTMCARATMYGAEAVSNVLHMVKQTFSIPRTVKPDLFIYDSNCNALREVSANNNTWFDNVGMPVDVFHHKSKHKISDTFCQEHCNPANYAEMKTPDGKWYFNSSAAEQCLRWFGGYAAIVREMLPVKYDFFLDEMILRRNRIIRAQLERRGKYPNYAII